MKSACVVFLFIGSVLCVDLILSGQRITLGGAHAYNNVALTNGAVITVPRFAGSDFNNNGNLILQISGDLTIDASSKITARGSGWQPVLCMPGLGPFSNAGGRGGCDVFDSGGGGAHIGAGGFGTKDCPTQNGVALCTFPHDQEENCMGAVSNGACVSKSDCRDFDGLPIVNGVPWYHSVYDNSAGIGFGAAGGDKGCRDGDGFSGVRGGAGGGRIVLNVTGTANIYGTINAEGERGCSLENDSGGGGAGGTILILANTLNFASTTWVTVKGGLGGDSQPKDLNAFPECVNTQLSGICDDCGGGGGGGLVYMLANSGNWLSDQWPFTNIAADGVPGGNCSGCTIEARGLDGRFEFGHMNELCNGIDDTYDGQIDEEQPPLPGCNLPSCINGTPYYFCPTSVAATSNTPTTVDTTPQNPTSQQGQFNTVPDSSQSGAASNNNPQNSYSTSPNNGGTDSKNGGNTLNRSETSTGQSESTANGSQAASSGANNGPAESTNQDVIAAAAFITLPLLIICSTLIIV